jgi:hypothetical protein
VEGARVHHPLERRGLLLHRRREAVLHERLADRVDRRVEARLALEAAARPVRHKRHKLVPDLVRHQAAVAPREPIVDHIGVRERCRRAVPGAVSRRRWRARGADARQGSGVGPTVRCGKVNVRILVLELVFDLPGPHQSLLDAWVDGTWPPLSHAVPSR